ncbi:MAG: transporter [Deltaproteobacteria bacterium]|nr:transporter [Deltaproteobacteria bacterium]
MEKKNFCFQAALIILAVFVSTAGADVLDPYDNMASPPGSLILVNYAGYMCGNNFYDQNGDKVGEFDLDYIYYVLRPVYTMKNKLFGHTWGFNAALPLASIEYKPELNKKKSASGLGDIVVGPFVFLYENEKTGTYLSLWEFIYTPTGSWDKNDSVNVGYHTWWFQHQVAYGQYWKKYALDICLNYWQKLEEQDHNYKEPDAFEFESIFTYNLTDKFYLAAHFDWWKSLENAESDGHDIHNSKTDFIKVGANLGYTINDKMGVNIRFMHDVEAQNYWKGPWVYLRLYFCY